MNLFDIYVQNMLWEKVKFSCLGICQELSTSALTTTMDMAGKARTPRGRGVVWWVLQPLRFESTDNREVKEYIQRGPEGVGWNLSVLKSLQDLQIGWTVIVKPALGFWTVKVGFALWAAQHLFVQLQDSLDSLVFDDSKDQHNLWCLEQHLQKSIYFCSQFLVCWVSWTLLESSWAPYSVLISDFFGYFWNITTCQRAMLRCSQDPVALVSVDCV